jgi:hypothetical protein
MIGVGAIDAIMLRDPELHRVHRALDRLRDLAQRRMRCGPAASVSAESEPERGLLSCRK